MLKQPRTTGVLEPPSPGCPSRRSSLFSASNSSLFSSCYDLYSGDTNADPEDDGSVCSLDSFHFYEEADELKVIKAKVNKPMTATIMPGVYFEKDSSRRTPPKAYIQREKAPVVCHVQTPPSSPSRRKGRLSSPAGSAHADATFSSSSKDLSVSFNDSISIASFDPQNLPYALAVATPISATKVVPCFCDICDRKDIEIQKQAQEIDQLKGLVTQLVTVLAQQQKEQQQQQSKMPVAKPQQTPKIAPVEAKTRQAATVTPQEAAAPQAQPPTPLETATSTPPKEDESTPSLSKQELPRGTTTPSSTVLRLCRLKQLKEESGVTAKAKPSHCRGKRHLYVSVAGNWGYYSGPALEQNQVLHGCVVRFDNGDLYLGDMILYVPTTLFFNDEHGLQFHGRGNLYRKDGSVTRGLFHKHQLME